MAATKDRPPRSALLTVLPVLALALGELWTLLNKGKGDTLSEVVAFVMGDKTTARYYAVTGFVAAWLVWLGLHWLVSPAVWRWQELCVLIAGFTLLGLGLWAVR